MEAGFAVPVIESLHLFEVVMDPLDFALGAGFGFEEGFEDGVSAMTESETEELYDMYEAGEVNEEGFDLVDFMDDSTANGFAPEMVPFREETVDRKKPFESFVDQCINDLNCGLR